MKYSLASSGDVARESADPASGRVGTLPPWVQRIGERLAVRQTTAGIIWIEGTSHELELLRSLIGEVLDDQCAGKLRAIVGDVEINIERK